MKMAGVLSQGICFPMSILPENSSHYQIGDDVTEILGIKKYEKQSTFDARTTATKRKPRPFKFLMRFSWYRKLILNKKQQKGFPDFLQKTDETRIQCIPWILEHKEPLVATEKIDGCSATYCLVRHKRKLSFLKDKSEYIVCSRNIRLWKDDNTPYWQVYKKYKLEKVLKEMIGSHDWVAIQGECIAPNVQGNKYHVSESDFYVFNLIYSDKGRIGSLKAREVCEKHGLKFVPILQDSFIVPDTVDNMLKIAHGESKLYPTLREGLVCRSQNGELSFKAVDPLFLIKHDE